MKGDVDKISAQLADFEARLELLRVPTNPVTGAPISQHPPSRPKRIEAKIAELNKKIHRAKNSRNKCRLTTKRDALSAELNWGPRQLEGAFSGAYRHYRIDGLPGMDPDTFFTWIRGFLVDIHKRETRTGAARSQATTWIRFRKDDQIVELAFNSRMLNVYNLSNMNV